MLKSWCVRRLGMDKTVLSGSTVLGLMFVMLLLFSWGCVSQGRITEGTVLRPYPYAAPVLEPVDIQVFRDGKNIQLVNHTVHSHKDFSLWINEHYVRQIDYLAAGGTRTFSLNEFVNEFGESFRAGGLLATRKSEPVVKAEIDTDGGMVGLIVIPEN